MSHGSQGTGPGTECPKCNRHTVVSINATLWKCLNCDFSKDFAKKKEDKKKADNTGVFTIVGGFIVAALCLLGI